jgi:hypothetical protein
MYIPATASSRAVDDACIAVELIDLQFYSDIFSNRLEQIRNVHFT